MAVLTTVACVCTLVAMPPDGITPRANARSFSQPQVSAWLLKGDAKRQAGRYKESRRYIERALAALQGEKPDSAEGTVAHAARLAAAYNYLSLLQNNCGQFTQSEASARQALSLAKDAHLNDETCAMHKVVLANALRQQGKFDEALPLLESAVATLKNAESSNQALLGTATNNLGALYFWRGDYQKALGTLQEGLRIRIAAHGANHVDVANSYLDLACTEIKLGLFIEALNHARAALEIRQEKLGKKHPETLASMSTLAVIYEYRSTALDITNALALLHDAVANGRKALGADHPDLAQYEDDYASLLGVREEYRQALPMMTDSLRIRKKVFGADSREYAGGLRSLAQIETSAGHTDAAGTLLQESVAIYKANGHSPDQDYADTLDALAAYYVGKKQLEPAREALLQAVEARRAGGTTVSYAVTCANLAEVLQAMGRTDESNEALKQAKSIVDALPTSQRSHPDCASIVSRFQNLCEPTGQKP